MTSSKALQIEKEIDAARCKASWSTIPELTRRYKKHNSEGSVLEQTVLAELTLTQTLSRYHREKGWYSSVYDDDTPDRISLPPRLPPELLKDVVTQLQNALKLELSPKAKVVPMAAMQKEFATIILARAHFESGTYAKTLELLDTTNVPLERASTGYAFVLLIMSKTIKGISLEMTGEITQALEFYDQVPTLLSQRPSEKSDELLNWSEEALYRAALLRARLGQPTETLTSFRAYQNAAAQWLPHWRVHKRVTLFRHFIRFLSRSYQSGQYVPPSAVVAVVVQGNGNGNGNGGPGTGGTSSYIPQTFRLELTHLHTIYEEKLYSIVSFPKAGHINRRVLEFVDQLVSDWEVMGGGSSIELRGLVETLQRAQHKTFNSPRIQRHLFNALIRLGEYEEAELALRAYLALTGHAHDHGMDAVPPSSHSIFPMTQGVSALNEEQMAAREREREKARERERENDAQPLTPTTTMAERGRKMSKSIGVEIGEERENDIDVVEVLIAGVRLMCKEMAKGEQAVEFAELAMIVWERGKGGAIGRVKGLEARVWRVFGIAYGMLASQTYDPDIRPTYHEKALSSLTNAIDLDPDSWESYYQLSLQYAEMRDINQATAAISKTLQLNPTHLSSWHLLTLLFSCPVQGPNPKQALQTCDIGLKESDWDAAASSSDPAEPHVPGLTSSTSTARSSDEGEQYLSLKMTQSALLEKLNGHEAGLQTHESLFTLYGKVYSTDTHSGNSSVYNGVSGGKRSGVVEGGIASGHASNDDVAGMVVHTGMTLSASAVVGVSGPLGSGTQLGASLSTPNVKANSVRSVEGTIGSMHLSPGTSKIRRGRKKSLGGISINTALASDIEKAGMGSAITAGSNLDIPRVSRTSSVSSSSLRSLHSPTPSIGTPISIKSIYQPITVPSRPSTRSRLRRIRSLRVLTSLWLASTAAFRRLGKLEEARKAVEEAEGVDALSPDLWCQLGLLSLADKKVDSAIMAFRKALACDPTHVLTKVYLGKTYLEMKEVELAEGLLESVTKGNGWDCAEAWCYLGQVFQQTDRIDRTKDCLWYALDLEGTRPVRPFSVLPRCL